MKSFLLISLLFILALTVKAQQKGSTTPQDNIYYIDSLASSIGNIPEELIKITENYYLIAPKG
jgi:hypothetical protein